MAYTQYEYKLYYRIYVGRKKNKNIKLYLALMELQLVLSKIMIFRKISILKYLNGTVMNPVATHHTAHHPWTTSPIMHCTHTFPSTITPITQLSPFTHHSDCLTTPAPHSLTHINAAHKHSPSAKSCFALATFLSVLPRICHLCV